MSNDVSVCKVTDLTPGSMRTYTVNGKMIALANVDGEFFAVDDTCTHEQCSLGSEGALDGNVIICGCHGGQFDVTSGTVVAPPAPTNVGTYITEVRNGEVFVQL